MTAWSGRTSLVAVAAGLVAVTGVISAAVKGAAGGDDGIGSSGDFAEVVIDRILDGCGISPNAEYIIDDELYLEDDPIVNAPEGAERWVVEIYPPSFDSTAYMIVRRLADGRFGDRVFDIGCP